MGRLWPSSSKSWAKSTASLSADLHDDAFLRPLVQLLHISVMQQNATVGHPMPQAVFPQQLATSARREAMKAIGEVAAGDGLIHPHEIRHV